MYEQSSYITGGLSSASANGKQHLAPTILNLHAKFQLQTKFQLQIHCSSTDVSSWLFLHSYKQHAAYYTQQQVVSMTYFSNAVKVVVRKLHESAYQLMLLLHQSMHRLIRLQQLIYNQQTNVPSNLAIKQHWELSSKSTTITHIHSMHTDSSSTFWW